MAPKDLIEPAFIVAAFTTGTVVNRQRQYRKSSNDLEARAHLISSNTTFRQQKHTLYSESLRSWHQKLLLGQGKLNHERHDTLASRLLARFPFLFEALYWNLTYWPYQILRAISAKAIRGNESIFNLAESHAIEILKREGALGIAIERPLQRYVLDHAPWLMPILGKVYYSHISVGVLFVIYTYSALPSSTFQRIRRTIAIDNFIAFAVLSMWRCMPPRMLPEEYGFVDVLHKSADQGTAWTNNSFQLTIAAMPSLHFGTALFLAYSVCRYSPHRWLRIVVPLWPMAMLATIIATANHFLLDAVVGAIVPVLGWKLNTLILVFEPLETWILSILGLQKPSRGTDNSVT